MGEKFTDIYKKRSFTHEKSEANVFNQNWTLVREVKC